MITENFEAYEMKQTYIPNIYSISLSVDANKPFLFKFMRDNLLEYLDEDQFLVSYQPDVFYNYVYNIPINWLLDSTLYSNDQKIKFIRDNMVPYLTGDVGNAVLNEIKNIASMNSSVLTDSIYLLGTLVALNFGDKILKIIKKTPKYEPYYGNQPIDNVYKWTTRWRWILPKDEDNNQKYIFSFYIPKLNFEPININVKMRTEPYVIGSSNKYENIPAGYLIQNKKQLITIKDINNNTIGEPFYLGDVSIGTNEDPNDNNNWLFRLIKHNLGHNANTVLTVNDLYNKDDDYIEKINRLFNDFSCRNVNMIEYITRCITDNVDIAKVQLNLLKTEIVKLTDITGHGVDALNVPQYLNRPEISGIPLDKPGFVPGYYKFFNGNLSEGVPAMIATLDNYGAMGYPGKENYFLTQYSVYPAVTHTYHRYNVTIDGITIEMSVNVDIKNHPVQEVLQPIFSIFLQGLSKTDHRIVKSFNTLSISEYIEFIKNNIKEGFKYIQKWIVLNVLKCAINVQSGTGTPNGFPRSGQPFYKDELKLSGYTITNVELTTGITTDIKAQPYLTKIIKLINDKLVLGFIFRKDDSNPSEFNNELNRENLDTILTSVDPIIQNPAYCVPLHYTGRLLIDKDLRIILKTNMKFMLTLNWINRNIIALLYGFRPEVTVEDPLFSDFKFIRGRKIGMSATNETDPESILEKILIKINNNTEKVIGNYHSVFINTSPYNFIHIFKNIDTELNLTDKATLDGLYNDVDPRSIHEIILDVDGNVKYMSDAIPNIDTYSNKLFKKYYDEYIVGPKNVKYINSYDKYKNKSPVISDTVNHLKVSRFNCLKLKYTFETEAIDGPNGVLDKQIEDAILQNIRVLSELCIKYQECFKYSEDTINNIQDANLSCSLPQPFNRSKITSLKYKLESSYNSFKKSFYAVASLLSEYGNLNTLSDGPDPNQIQGIDARIGGATSPVVGFEKVHQARAAIIALKNAVTGNIDNNIAELVNDFKATKPKINTRINNALQFGSTLLLNLVLDGEINNIIKSSGSLQNMRDSYTQLITNQAYIDFQKINSHIRGYTVSNLNETLAIYEKPIFDFAKSFWIDHTVQSIDIFIDEISTINKFKLFIKMLFIYTYLLNDEAGRILVNTETVPGSNINRITNNVKKEGEGAATTLPNRYEILLKDPNSIRASTTEIDEDTPLNFYGLFNKDETLNKLIKLARHKVIIGTIKIETTEEIIKDNGFFDVSYQIGTYDKVLLVSGPTSQSPMNLRIKDNYNKIKIKGVPLIDCIKNLVAALKWSGFRKEVDILYKNLLKKNTSIDVLENNELLY